MTPEALSALYGSISKWRGIVDGTIEDLGSDNCVLCQVFLDEPEMDICQGCPVRLHTGIVGCGGTPYGHYSLLADYLESEPEARSPDLVDRLQSFAIAELEFLVSLLPDDPNRS